MRLGHHLGALPGRGVGGPGATWDALRRRAEVVELAGYDSLWVPDHVLAPPPELAGAVALESMTLLGALAGATTSVTLGPLVAAAAHRPPALLAASIRALDEVSGGRAWCGLGAGWWAEEHRRLGVALLPVGPRLDRLDATAGALRAELDRQPGRRIPLLIGGGGEARTLRIAARYGDACNVGGSPTVVGRKVAALRRHCAALGRDPATVQVTVLVSLGDDAPGGGATGSSAGDDAESAPEDGSPARLGGSDGQMLDLAAAYHRAGCDHLIAAAVDSTTDDAVARLATVLAPLRHETGPGPGRSSGVTRAPSAGTPPGSQR